MRNVEAGLAVPEQNDIFTQIKRPFRPLTTALSVGMIFLFTACGSLGDSTEHTIDKPLSEDMCTQINLNDKTMHRKFFEDLTKYCASKGYIARNIQIPEDFGKGIVGF